MYIDEDGDGFGSPTHSQCAVSLKSDERAVRRLYDSDSDVNPDMQEDCSTTVDDNCDGEVSEVDALNCLDWYADVDGDGYAGGAPMHVPTKRRIQFSEALDCDDSTSEVSPDQRNLQRWFGQQL